MPLQREEARGKHGPSDLERALKEENKRLMRTNKKLRKRIGNEEWLVEEIQRRILMMREVPTIAQASRVESSAHKTDRPLAAVLVIADPHMEEVVDPAETEGMLEWNMDVFLRAAWRMIEATIEIVGIMRASQIINDLYILWLGDMVTGEIHTDVYYSNAFYLPDALTMGPWYWSQFVRELSAHFDLVSNWCVPGNHGRLDRKPSSKKTVGRNWDTCLYQNIAVQTRTLKNVEWHIPRSVKKVVPINDWFFMIQHGDRVPQHGGVVPYYGMMRQRSAEMAKRMGIKVSDVVDRLQKGLLFDYDIRGHSHEFGTISERTLLCPSMMGNNQFGFDNTFSRKMRGSRLFFVDKEHGMAGDWRINLMNLQEEHGFQELPVWDQDGEAYGDAITG